MSIRGVAPGLVLLIVLRAFAGPSVLGAIQASNSHISSCEVSLTVATELSDADYGPGLATAWVDSNGVRIFVGDVDDRSSVRVFDASTGAYLTSLGREGAGPGEFRAVAGVRVYGDSLLVYDRSNLRISLFDGSLALVDDWPAAVRGAPFQPFEYLEGSLTLLSGWNPTPTSAGHPFHVFDATGRHLRSFGADPTAPVTARPSIAASRLVSRSHGTTFWAVRASRYELEQWDAATGAPIRSVFVDARWLHDGYGTDGRELGGFPPALLAIEEAGSDLLWVLGRRTLLPGVAPLRENELSDLELSEAWSLVLDLVSPASGVLATVDLPGYAGGILRTGQVFTFPSTNQIGRMQVWDPVLRCDR